MNDRPHPVTLHDLMQAVGVADLLQQDSQGGFAGC